MDLRHPIHDSPDPVVHSVAFSEDGSRFVCGMENGIRVFRSKDCVRTVKKSPGLGRGIAIAETLDDRHTAVVGGGRLPNSSHTEVEFWDTLDDRLLAHLDMSESILGIRVTAKYFVIILEGRVVCMDYVYSEQDAAIIPGGVRGIYDTALNPYALCCISGDTLALPGLTSGQAQIVHLADKRKRVIPAHNSALRAIALSKDGEVLATAGEQGTLIRVFSVTANMQTHEFRRGVERAVIFSLAISPSNRFVASTSDKGTLHIYDLRPPPTEEVRPPPKRRISNTRPAAVQRTRPGSVDFDTASIPSGSSSPMPGTGFYGPPSDLAHTPPTAGPSVFAAIGRLPGMPRAFSDARSMTSTPYHLGSDPQNWQGQPAYSVTTNPDGNKQKVANPNVPLPGRPDGKPPKGIIAWDPHADDRRLWVVGGGADARWEVFDLLEDQSNHTMKVVKVGFRKYLTRQFPEK
ncbi:hypothetical protein AAFC00_000948 [Neodothiora populina]|uniref:WD40 repeat-like protein n=1 Tax=Neodothiora populina TaxID=2781224 RepID=A0ABR3PMP0_9PEZI